MDKLTKGDIAKMFELDEEAQQYLDTITTVYKVVEEREKEFINKVLKPWVVKMEDLIKDKSMTKLQNEGEIMKVQWQLIDIETGKKYILRGEFFNLNLELLKVKLRRLWKGKGWAEPIEVSVKDIRTDELKADMIYDYPGKLAELLKREA